MCVSVTVTVPAYQNSVMISLRVVVVLYNQIGLQSTPVTVTRGSPREIRFLFLRKVKYYSINCPLHHFLYFDSSAYHAVSAASVGDRIETVTKSEFGALHYENLAATVEFVAPPTHSFEEILATMDQLFG